MTVETSYSFSRSLKLIVARIFTQTLIISPRLLFSCARSRNLNVPLLVSAVGVKGAQTNTNLRVSVSGSININTHNPTNIQHSKWHSIEPSFCEVKKENSK